MTRKRISGVALAKSSSMLGVSGCLKSWSGSISSAIANTACAPGAIGRLWFSHLDTWSFPVFSLIRSPSCSCVRPRFSRHSRKKFRRGVFGPILATITTIYPWLPIASLCSQPTFLLTLGWLHANLSKWQNEPTLSAPEARPACRKMILRVSAVCHAGQSIELSLASVTRRLLSCRKLLRRPPAP